MIATVDLSLLERIQQGLTVDTDAITVQRLVTDLHEIVEGVRTLASQGLDALEANDWRTVRQSLEKLARIE